MPGPLEKIRILAQKFYKVGVMTSSWGPEEWQAIWNAVRTSTEVRGSQVPALYRKTMKEFAVKNVWGTHRGESAIFAALSTLAPGNVIMPSYLCGNVIQAARNAGHKAVLVDVDDHYNIDPSQALDAVNVDTRAIIVPSLYGRPAELQTIERHCPAPVMLIDDAAQAWGAKHYGQAVGTFGDAGILSLGAKTITATSGGLLLQKKGGRHTAAFRQAVGQLSDQTRGRVLSRLADTALRYSYRTKAAPFLALHHAAWRRFAPKKAEPYATLSNLDAALALAQWPKVASINQRRTQNAHLLDDVLGRTTLTLPEKHSGHVYSKYIIRLPAREGRRTKPWAKLERFIRHMAMRGVECERCYVPLHLKAGIRDWFVARRANLDVTERLWWNSVALPNHAELDEPTMHWIAQQVKDSLKNM